MYNQALWASTKSAIGYSEDWYTKCRYRIDVSDFVLRNRLYMPSVIDEDDCMAIQSIITCRGRLPKRHIG